MTDAGGFDPDPWRMAVAQIEDVFARSQEASLSAELFQAFLQARHRDAIVTAMIAKLLAQRGLIATFERRSKTDTFAVALMLLAELQDLRDRFHKAVVLGIDDDGRSDLDCARCDAVIARAEAALPPDLRLSVRAPADSSQDRGPRA